MNKILIWTYDIHQKIKRLPLLLLITIIIKRMDKIFLFYALINRFTVCTIYSQLLSITVLRSMVETQLNLVQFQIISKCYRHIYEIESFKYVQALFSRDQCSCLKIGGKSFMKILNRLGLNVSPCLTTLVTSNQLVSVSLILLEDFLVEYIYFIT